MSCVVFRVDINITDPTMTYFRYFSPLGMLGCVSRVLAGAAVARSCQVAARRGVAVSRLHTHEMEIGDGRCGTQKIFDRYRKYLTALSIPAMNEPERRVPVIV